MATMTHPTTTPPSLLPTEWTLADLQVHLGGIPLDRIRLYPPPGMATRTATVYRSATDVVSIDDNGRVHGAPVLPGFEFRLGDLLDKVLRE